MPEKEEAATVACNLQERVRIKNGMMPRVYIETSVVIALAAMNGMNFLATWNFSHINNAFTRMLIRKIVEDSGYACPELVSPEELPGGEK